MASLNDLKKKISLDSEIPEHVVQLPSNRQKATIRPMKVKEQKSILKAIEKADEYLINEAFDVLLDKCVIAIDGEPFDNDTLCVNDRIFLLIKIQELTNGPKTKVQHINPKTGSVIKDIEVDISTLPVVYNESDSLITDIQLSSTIFVSIGPITRKDEKDMGRWRKVNKSGDSVVDRRYCAYAGCIKKVFSNDNGEIVNYDLSFEDKLQFISDNCTMAELKKIDEYLKTIKFGIELKIDIQTDDYSSEDEALSLISFFIN